MNESREITPVGVTRATPYGVVEDGWGSRWTRCKANCGLQVVRPGKVQCDCDEPS